MGALTYTSGSGSFTVPPEVQKVWVSCIGQGGNGSLNLVAGTLTGGGGGGWGYGIGNVPSTSIPYTVGTPSSCLGITGFNGGDGTNSSPGAGGGFVGPFGANGTSGIFGTVGPTIGQGGAAGGVSGSAESTYRFLLLGTPPQQFVFTFYAGGGGNGNDGFGGTTLGGVGVTFIPPTTPFSFGTYVADGGEGGLYGGGGGGSGANGPGGSDGGPGIAAGIGGSGLVYVDWIDMSADKTTLRSGETANVTWSSPFESGSSAVSWGNNGTTNNIVTYTITDARGAQSSLTFTILPAARILSFTANPNPQTSGFDGVPNFDTILSWTTAGATTASIIDIGSVSVNGSETITNLPQSTAGITSPAIKSYILTVSDGFNIDTETLIVSVTNDNIPNDYNIPNQSNLEPDTFYVINLGPITGIDMVTNVIGGPGITVSKNNLQNYVSSITIVNNDSVQLRFRSDEFNQDPTGLPTVPISLYIDIGPVRRFFTISTRAPDVNEIFDLPDENNRVPFPDIDTISEPSLPYVVSDTLVVDDIELQDPSGVEIKTDNPNMQVRKKIPGSLNWGPWEDVRSI